MSIATASYKVLAKPPALEMRSVIDPISHEDIILQFKTEGDFPKLAKVVKSLSPEPSVKVGETFVVFNTVGDDVMSLENFRDYIKNRLYANKPLITPNRKDIDLKSLASLVGFGGMKDIYQQELSQLSTKEAVLNYLKNELSAIIQPLYQGNLESTNHGKWFTEVTQQALERLQAIHPPKQRHLKSGNKTNYIKQIENIALSLGSNTEDKTSLISAGAFVGAPKAFFEIFNSPELIARRCLCSKGWAVVEKASLNSPGEISGHMLILKNNEKVSRNFLTAHENVYSLSLLKRHYHQEIMWSLRPTYPNTTPAFITQTSHLELLGDAKLQSYVHNDIKSGCELVKYKAPEEAPHLIEFLAELIAKGVLPRNYVKKRLDKKPKVSTLTYLDKYIKVASSDAKVEVRSSLSTWACFLNRPKVIEEISLLFDINQYPSRTHFDQQSGLRLTSCLYIASQRRSYESVQALFDNGYIFTQDTGQTRSSSNSEFKETCLAIAIQNKDERMIRLLHDCGCKLDEKKCRSHKSRSIESHGEHQSAATSSSVFSSLQIAANCDYPEFLTILKDLGYQITDSSEQLVGIENLALIAKERNSTAFLDKLSRDYGYENTDEADQPSQANGS